MDILTHTLSGIAIGTCISSFSGRGIRERIMIIGFSGFGGAFPDIDAISLWSGFDRTFGKLFGLNNSGKTIYFSKFWYSHHGFFHSILASIMIAILFGSIIYLIHKGLKKSGKMNLIDYFKINFLILIGFIGGFIIHLVEDMPTPSCVWGGVRLLWPLENYFGGTGEIWWWNNYDIFIIVVGLIILNILIISLKRVIKIDLRKLTVMTTLIAFTICIIQVKTRGYDFNYKGQTPNFQKYEQKSKEIQREKLGSKVYGKMEKFDKKIRINF